MEPASCSNMRRPRAIDSAREPAWVLFGVCAMTALWMFRSPIAPNSVLGTIRMQPDQGGPACIVIERKDRGAICMPMQEAARLGLRSGDVWSADTVNLPRPRMAPRRLMLSGVRLDINRATAEELIALPEIGAGLSRAILKARAQHGRLRCQADLEQVPGLGARRLRRILPFIEPLSESCLSGM